MTAVAAARTAQSDLTILAGQARLVLADLLTGRTNLESLSDAVDAGAACTRSALPIEAWLPTQRTIAATRAETEPARAVCDACPVRLRCLTRALVTDLGRQDVAGGLVPREMRQLRRRVASLLTKFKKKEAR